MQEETEPGKHQHRQDAGDDEVFVVFHGYASTMTSVVGFAWQARMMPLALSSTSSASWTAISTSPELIFTLQIPQVPTRQEFWMPIASSSESSRMVASTWI